MIEDRPARLDPDLAADILALAMERGGPRSLERTVLRSRSRTARDLLAYAAAGRRTADELVGMLRAAQTPGGAAAPQLDLAWSLSLARVIGMQAFDQDDLSDAVLLLKELIRQHPEAMQDPSVQQTVVDRLWQAGEHDLLRSWRVELTQLRPTVQRYLDADLVNPFIAQGDPDHRTLQRWQRLLDPIFVKHEIEPITVLPGAATPFDGLTCRTDAGVIDGPLVTVIMPVYRPGQELITSVRSICDQTWSNLEILVMDDASPSGHEDVLNAVAALDERVQVHRMDRNGGTYLARNAALDIATGDLVTVQDADDWSHPRRIELQARALLADPGVPATRSFCLRVSEDLVLTRPGYETSQENASSLMFRREQALATVGYFDRSRKSADTEYRRRLELATGALTVDLLAPLAMVRMAGGSLSRADFTPGWHHVSRYVYRGAYERWHAQIACGSDPYMPRFPERRRFAIPQRFQIDQEVIAQQPPQVDVVLLADWRWMQQPQQALLNQLENLCTHGLTVGVAHRESYLRASARRHPLHPMLVDLLNRGEVQFVALDQVAKARLLVADSPEVLQFAPMEPGELEVDQVLVLADGHPLTTSGRHRYDAAACDAAAVSTFSVEPIWICGDPEVRSALERHISPRRITLPQPTFQDQVHVALGPDHQGAAPVQDDEPLGTTPAAPTSGPRPTWKPHPAPAPRPDLRVVLTVGPHHLPRLAETLPRLRDDAVLFGAPVTVVHAPEIEGEIQELAIHHPAVSFISAEGASRTDLAEAAAQQMTGSGNTLFTVVAPPRTRSIRSWSRGLAKEIARLEQLGLDSPLPLLVQTRHTSREATAAHIKNLLERGEIPPGRYRDYLAGLLLLAASPKLEAVDPRGEEIDVFAWLSAKLAPGTPRPPWRYRIVLTRGREQVLRSEPANLSLRVDNRGHEVWADLRAALPLAEAGDGNFVLAVEVDTEEDLLRVRRRLRPSKGVLLNSRTVMTRRTRDSGEVIRYLVHPGTSGETFLTTQVGTGRLDRPRWAVTMVRKDLGSVLRRRGSRRMLLLRALRLATKPFFAGRRIWLVGERTDTAQDNGLHLFRHLRQVERRRNVYYVIDRSSSQRDRVAGMGNVVDHSSWRHQLLMLHADVLANAYSIRYLTPSSWPQEDYIRHIAWRVGALRVYLKHGVHLNPNAVKRGLSGYDLFLTVMPRESAAIRKVSGYDRQIREIGMPRYDGLVPAPQSRSVLFMPTWRQYLVPRLGGRPNPGQIPFEGSAYEQFVSAFLTSPRLHDLLEQHDYTLTFLPHYNMASAFDTTLQEADRISVADTDQTVFQDLLRNCDAFITDYSSVHFDVAYLGTPVIYARFDDADYESGHASRSWFDYEQDGYGPVAHGLDGVIDALERTLAGGCVVGAEYAARVAGSFTFRDRGNSARVVAAIDELSQSRRRGIEPGGPIMTSREVASDHEM